MLMVAATGIALRFFVQRCSKQASARLFSTRPAVRFAHLPTDSISSPLLPRKNDHLRDQLFLVDMALSKWNQVKAELVVMWEITESVRQPTDSYIKTIDLNHSY